MGKTNTEALGKIFS